MQQAMPKVKQHFSSKQDAQRAEVAGLVVRCTADDVLHEVQSCSLQRPAGDAPACCMWRQRSWPALL